MSEEYISKIQDPNINLLDINQQEYIVTQMDYSKIVDSQLSEFKDLDINVLEMVELSNLIFTDCLVLVNENYITIPGIETILVDPNTLNLIGKFIYELFVNELLNYILPNMLLTLDLKDPTELTVLAYDGFRSTLQQVTSERLTSIKELYVKSGNSKLYIQLLKWTFYVDLFDNDLENFIDRVIIPILDLYRLNILSRVIEL